MSEELKPCPFCGGMPNSSAPGTYIIAHPSMSANDWYVSCRSCRYSISQETWDEVKAAWNRRAADDAKQSAGIETEYTFYWNGADRSGTFETWISDEFSSFFPSNCPKCGAPMQIVRPGRAECSASCWLDDADTENWHKDDDKRGGLAERVEALEARIAAIEARPAHGYGYTRGHTV